MQNQILEIFHVTVACKFKGQSWLARISKITFDSYLMVLLQLHVFIVYGKMNIDCSDEHAVKLCFTLLLHTLCKYNSTGMRCEMCVFI